MHNIIDLPAIYRYYCLSVNGQLPAPIFIELLLISRRHHRGKVLSNLTEILSMRVWSQKSADGYLFASLEGKQKPLRSVIDRLTRMETLNWLSAGVSSGFERLASILFVDDECTHYAFTRNGFAYSLERTDGGIYQLFAQNQEFKDDAPLIFSLSQRADGYVSIEVCEKSLESRAFVLSLYNMIILDPRGTLFSQTFFTSDRAQIIDSDRCKCVQTETGPNSRRFEFTPKSGA
jgi:hypothetical protein